MPSGYDNVYIANIFQIIYSYKSFTVLLGTNQRTH